MGKTINDLMFANASGGNEMGTKIEDGLGSGREVAVNAANQLYVTTETPYQRAIRLGDAFSWENATADIDTTDTMIIVRNDSATRLLVVEAIAILNGNVGASTYHIHYVTTAYTNSGTNIVGVNENPDFGSPIDVTATADEVNNVQGKMLFISIHTAASTPTSITRDQIPILGSLTLGQGQAIGIDQVTESTAGTGTIYGYFIDK